MIPSEFQYFAPTTVDEAVGLLQQHGDEAKLLAGGHSLLPALKLTSKPLLPVKPCVSKWQYWL